MKYSGHRKLLCEFQIIKIKCFNPPRILDEHWCIYSCLQIPPRENWFQYVRRAYATAINLVPWLLVTPFYSYHQLVKYRVFRVLDSKKSLYGVNLWWYSNRFTLNWKYFMEGLKYQVFQISPESTMYFWAFFFIHKFTINCIFSLLVQIISKLNLSEASLTGVENI